MKDEDWVEYSCEKCDYKTTTNRNLKQHVKSNHEENENKNDGIKQLNKKKRKFENNSFSCDICDFISKNENSLKKHMKTSHESKKLKN